MYKNKLMDYYQQKQWRGIVPNANMISQKANPSCGDEISFTGTIEGDSVVNIKYEGAGCIMSQAVAAYLCDYVHNKSLNDLTNLTSDDILADLELTVGPNRLQCIELPLDTLREALASYHAQ